MLRQYVKPNLDIVDGFKIVPNSNRFPITGWRNHKDNSLKGSGSDTVGDARTDNRFKRAAQVNTTVCLDGPYHCLWLTRVIALVLLEVGARH